MWLRARRPTMEKVLGDMWDTLTSAASTTWGPIQGVVDAHLPGFGYKVLGFVGLLIGYNISVMMIQSRTEAWMFLEKMHLYSIGDNLVKQGFFASDQEEHDSRHHAKNHARKRLEDLWDTAIADATQKR